MNRRHGPKTRSRTRSPKPPSSVKARGRARETHPLLSPFPLAVMALGTAVLLFAVMMALLNPDAQSDMRASTAAAPGAAGHGAVLATARPGRARSRATA